MQYLGNYNLQRQQAEAELNKLYGQQGYALLLLRIIEMHSAGPAEPDVSIRQAAAINFKVRSLPWPIFLKIPERWPLAAVSSTSTIDSDACQPQWTFLCAYHPDSPLSLYISLTCVSLGAEPDQEAVEPW